MSEMTGFELTALHSLESPDRVGDLLAISSKVPMPSIPADVTRESIEVNEARISEERASRRETGSVVDVFA